MDAHDDHSYLVTETTPEPPPVTTLTRTDVVPPAELGQLELMQVRRFVQASKARSTIRGYRSDWADFSRWCSSRGVPPLPAAPETVAAYAADSARRLRPGSIQRRLNSITEAHKAVGLDSPTTSGVVKNTMKGVRRELGTRPAQKSALLISDIRAMIGAASTGIIGLRDRAIILLGFAGAFRRSEIVTLELADLQFDQDGLTVTLRRSKTDQEGRGRSVGIPSGRHAETCPVRSLETWIREARILDGPIFRSITRDGRVRDRGLSPIDVARVVKKLAERAGLDPAAYAGHSLRRGHVTSAAMGDASEIAIMKQTGHRSSAMVRRYIADANLFRNNSASKLDL